MCCIQRRLRWLVHRSSSVSNVVPCTLPALQTNDSHFQQLIKVINISAAVLLFSELLMYAFFLVLSFIIDNRKQEGVYVKKTRLETYGLPLINHCTYVYCKVRLVFFQQWCFSFILGNYFRQTANLTQTSAEDKTLGNIYPLLYILETRTIIQFHDGRVVHISAQGWNVRSRYIQWTLISR